MDNKFDFIIINLKVLSQLQRMQKVRTTSAGYFTIEHEHLLVPIKRTVYGDSRDKLIKDMNNLLQEITMYVTWLENSENNGSKYIALQKELTKCLQGLENLKTTYEGDSLVIGELELIVDKVISFIGKLEAKNIQ